MKARKRIIAALLAGCMVFGMTGCMTQSGNGGKKGETQKKVEETEGPLAPYKETVKISTVMPENAGIQFQEGDSYDDNPWYREFKERLNIEVTNDWVSNDYNTKLNLSIADGNIPDVMFVNKQSYQELVNADLIWDLTEVYEKYASDTLKGFMEQEKETFELTKRNGKLYAIPQLSYGIIDNPSQVWLRQDWANEAGIEDIKTMDDLKAAAKVFKEKHGKYAIAEDQNLTAFNILATGFGAQPQIWVEKDGAIEYGSIQPEMKEALAEYAEWYKEGLLSEDFVTTDMDKMFQDLINGDVGISPMAQWFGYNPGVDIIANCGPEAVFDAYKVPSANGADVKACVLPANYGYIVVSKKCQNPEAAIKLINFYVYSRTQEAVEKEGADFYAKLNDHAYDNLAYAFRVIDPNTDYNIYETVSAAVAKYLETGEKTAPEDLGPALVKYQDCIKWIDTKDPQAVGNWNQQGSPKSAYGVAKDMLDNDEYVVDALKGRDIEAINSMGSTLDDILLEGFTKIIVGDEPIDYFDTLVENWKTAGGTKATEEVNKVCK